jgi:hypothetical protein
MGYGQLHYGGPPQQQQPMAVPQPNGAETYRGAVTSSYGMPVLSQGAPPNMGAMPPQQPMQPQQQPQPQQQHQTQQQGMQPQQQSSAAPNAMNGRPASPLPPTGNFFEDRGILFYGSFTFTLFISSFADVPSLVKALYDYTATIEEEFDFQAGDVIAVLATPDDGWWQGILLDDSRRQPGRTVFPSNFVCLF